MTDRLKGVIVTFDKDYRDDDAEVILSAIRMIRGVADVSPLVSDRDDYMARARVRADLLGGIVKLFELPRGSG